MMPTLQLRRRSLFWFQEAWELGRAFGDELFCFCLFVFQLPRWVIILFLFLSLTSGWGFLVFFCFLFFVFVFVFVFCFLCFVFCVVFSSKCSISPPYIKGQVDICFCFCFCFFVSPVGKVFCFLLFLLFALLPKIPPPWYQMVRPYPYSITQMMVDITSSTILNSRAIQWKI